MGEVQRFRKLKSALNELNGTIFGSVVTMTEQTDGYYTGSDTTITGSIVYTANSNSKAYIANLSDYVGQKVVVYFDMNGAAGVRLSALCNSSGIISQAYREPQMTKNGFSFNITATDYMLYVSFKKETSGNLRVYLVDGSINETVQKLTETTNSLIIANKAVYVSTVGNDSNIGDYDHPLATVNKALELGASTVLLFGGVYGQQIDLSKLQNPVLTIGRAEPGKAVTFKDPNAVIATSDTIASGYTRVHRVDLIKTIDANAQIWIFQEGVADASTVISAADRMPVQRGKTYRCDDTKIIHVTNTSSLTGALTEIENDTTNYKFHVATSGALIYYSCPNTVSAAKPITISFGNSLFLNNWRCTINMTGIDVMYYNINIDYTENSVISDCTVHNYYGKGGFSWTKALNASFIRCEASRTYKAEESSIFGDGFNADGYLNAYADIKQCTVTLKDCWSHDNLDDGYSGHHIHESSIFGGLFEYNGKGGVTPSYGEVCTCYGVVSRYNWHGFYYIGDGNRPGTLKCVDCIAYGNTTHPTTYGDGFRVNSGNQMVLVDCKSIANKYGYRSGEDCVLTMYDCTAKNNTASVIHSDSGTINIVNTDLVTSG